MSLIDYPDLPAYPGVPDIKRAGIGALTVSGLGGVILANDRFGIFDHNFAPKWQILDEDGNVAITPDSVISFEFRGEARPCSHPVERGGFQDYNKIQMPYDARMIISCNGQGATKKDALLRQLEEYRKGTDLLQVATPDAVYPRLTLQHYDYRREAQRGVQLLTIQLWFTEIRQPEDVEPVYKKPSSFSIAYQGLMGTVTAKIKELAAFVKAKIQ